MRSPVFVCSTAVAAGFLFPALQTKNRGSHIVRTAIFIQWRWKGETILPKARVCAGHAKTVEPLIDYWGRSMTYAGFFRIRATSAACAAVLITTAIK